VTEVGIKHREDIHQRDKDVIHVRHKDVALLQVMIEHVLVIHNLQQLVRKRVKIM
jgi:hypothetical protein